ncbi:hypothetical protein CKAN_02580900 [Cinnamomum micranthum f. kanehirae]|uniref:Uncharacterized protein n=1 Tax=Cinnamomum micranthum f. kanehirae TaxID=337451 RepID=A0A3S3NC42_9MAGN|nr:hypothetical protein CKAN_02580900 [Cinnamomum micranthum f. kanehirae]
MNSRVISGGGSIRQPETSVKRTVGGFLLCSVGEAPKRRRLLVGEGKMLKVRRMGSDPFTEEGPISRRLSIENTPAIQYASLPLKALKKSSSIESQKESLEVEVDLRTWEIPRDGV